VKPSKIFGPEDRFLNATAYWATRLGYLPIIDDGSTIIQPVYAADVGKALLEIVKNCHDLEGKTFQLAGPDEYTYKEVVELVRDTINMQDRSVASYPASVWKFLGHSFENLMHPSLTHDEVIQMMEDTVIKENQPDWLNFSDLNIEPTSMERIAFGYLHRFRWGGHFKVIKGYHSQDILGKHGVGGDLSSGGYGVY
jgi:NADH dehydrogenase (ubiquinone) 1 alpha subcomplex subunit 9